VVIEMAGGKDVDNNAVLFANGANSVLKAQQSDGKLKIASESVVKGWDVNQAAPLFTQALTANGGKVNAVLAANDDIANAVIGVLKGNGLAGHVVVTGQDSGVEGLDNIITGILASLVVFAYEQKRYSQTLENLRIVAEMNHHVRNALQVILCSRIFGEHEQQVKVIADAARRIEWALREVLPGQREDIGDLEFHLHSKGGKEPH